MSRYLFEHLFLGHLFFEADATHRAFRLVRSSTPPGEPLQIIASRRPYDDPGVARFWYRLVPEREVILAKTHMPYGLSPARMAKYRGWFLGPEVQVDALPSYAVEVASNPFDRFPSAAGRRTLPLPARRSAVLHHELHQGAGVPRTDGGGRDRGPVLGGLRRTEGADRGERGAGGAAPGREPDAAGRNGQRCAPARAVVEDGTPGAPLPAVQEPGLAADLQQRQGEARSVADLGRRGPQPQCGADHLPPLRQRVGGAGLRRRAAEDRMGHRLPAVRAHLLPAGGRLRRLRQCRPPTEQPPVHGLHAHGRRVQLPGVAAAARAREHRAVLVPRRRWRGARIRLWQERLSRCRKRCALPQRRPAARAVPTA